MSESLFLPLEKNMRSLFVLACSLLAFAACGSDVEKFENKDTETPTAPKGSITGVVTDGMRQPLEGASVIARVADKERVVVSDAEGRFTITGLPAGGNIGLEISAEGHGKATLSRVIPNAAGKFPLKDASVFVGPIALYRMDHSFEWEVVVSDGRTIAVKDAQCFSTATWADWSEGFEAPVYELVFAEAEVSSGKIACSGLTSREDLLRVGGPLWVGAVVPAQDLDGDGFPDTHGIDQVFGAAELIGEGAPTTLILPRLAEGLELLASSLKRTMNGGASVLESPLGAKASIELVFNRPVEVHHSAVLDERGLEGIEHEIVNSPSGTRVSVRPKDAWPEGEEINLALLVGAPGLPAEGLRIAVPAVVLPKGELKVSSLGFLDDNDNGELDPGEQVELVFSQVVGDGEDSVWIPFFIDFDIDDSGEIGDAECEKGNAMPCWFESDEPAVPGGYDSYMTRHYKMEWDLQPVDKDSALSLDFPRTAVGAPVYTADGKPVLKALGAKLKAVAPNP